MNYFCTQCGDEFEILGSSNLNYCPACGNRSLGKQSELYDICIKKGSEIKEE